MKKITFCIFSLLFSIPLLAQHKFSTYRAHHSLHEAITMSSEVIEGRTLDFEKKAEGKPLMFQSEKVKIGELNRIANNLSKFIEKTQEDVNSERVLYDLLDDYHYRDLFFDEYDQLTYKGDSLKTKIDSLYNYSLKINIHQLSQLENFSNNHFKTSADYYDDDGQKINFFNYVFSDKSNYGMMMAMNYLLLDVKTFQLLYFGTIMTY